MLRLLSLLVVLLGMSVQASANDRPVVVELFTSQGCSACPPADAFLAELGKEADIIPLALHVDYWDYIGWTDQFADPANTARQKGYARAGGWRTIYTPQIIVNGTEVAVGSRKDQVRAALRKAHNQPDPVSMRVTRNDDMLKVELRPTGGPVGPVDIHVVRYTPSLTVEILRGENAGRRMEYTHIVEEWDVVARWNGASGFRADVPLMGSGPVVVLAQVPDHGPILAAARLR